MDVKNEDNKYIYTLVGKNIRRLRKKHGLTQVKLAEAIGYNDGTVSNVENSSFQTFSLEFVYIISKLLNEPMLSDNCDNCAINIYNNICSTYKYTFNVYTINF